MKFADPCDEAAAREQQAIEVALASRTRIALAETGHCHNCSEPLTAGLFCDSDCRDDYELRLRAMRQWVA